MRITAVCLVVGAAFLVSNCTTLRPCFHPKTGGTLYQIGITNNDSYACYETISDDLIEPDQYILTDRYKD